MNTLIDFTSESSKTCEGRCIKEMQKLLEPPVIMEFFEVIRDFYNDEKTAAKLKNIILSETTEAVKILNERASEMVLMVDEIFLNRRQRQTSFYRLCHKLARRGLPEESSLPDESKCVCFSEENLRRFGVDPSASTSLEFSSNITVVKEALKKYFGELRCADCGRFLQLCESGSMLSCISDCSCSSPSVSSQHKVHEAILELCKVKDNTMICQDSWYLTQLKRDADYYKNRSRKSSVSLSDESVNSFEVISPSNHTNFEENDAMDNESLASDFSVQEKLLINTKSMDPVQKVKSSANINTFPVAIDIQELSKNLSNKLVQSLSSQPSARNLTDASKKKCAYSQLHLVNGENRAEKKLSPASVLRQSFSPYFNKCNKATYRSSATKVPTAEYLRRSLQKLQIDSKSLEIANKSVDTTCKQQGSNPTDSLKCAMSSYFKKEMSENWLRV